MPTVLISGSQTAVIDTKHFLVSNNATNGTFIFDMDSRNMELGDIIEVEVLTASSQTGPVGRYHMATYGPLTQSSPIKKSIPFPSPFQFSVTLQQLDSTTGKIFDWYVANLE